MPEALKKQIFGLPRWAWLSILIAAVAIGLYLRHQRKVEEENGEEGNVSSGPAGELIEPPYEGSGPYPGGGEGAGGSEYFGGNEMNLERQEAKEIRDQESKEAKEIREEEKEERIWLRDHPGVTTETAPSAQGADQFPSGGSTGTSETPSEPKKKTASTGGGPPGKPNAGSKASGVIRGGDINTPMTPGQAAKSTAVGVGGGGGNNNPPAQNNTGGAPQNNHQHPAAENTGNKCVNGGVGGHTPASGYHLFCQGGWIWRAPNS